LKCPFEISLRIHLCNAEPKTDTASIHGWELSFGMMDRKVKEGVAQPFFRCFSGIGRKSICQKIGLLEKFLDLSGKFWK